MAQMVFRRVERKYLLAGPQATVLQQLLQGPMRPDGYGRHTICSLYYDSPDYACAAAQADGAYFRQKLRLRSYGVPGPDSMVYLELKKKLGGVTHKRRAGLPYGEALAWMKTGAAPQTAGQIFAEADWFARQNGLLPQTVVCYERVAFFAPDSPDLRVTFDEDIRGRAGAPSLGHGSYGTPLCPPDTVLMEIKAPGAVPLWLARLLSQQGVYPAKYSKFMKSVELLGANRPAGFAAAKGGEAGRRIEKGEHRRAV